MKKRGRERKDYPLVSFSFFLFYVLFLTQFEMFPIPVMNGDSPDQTNV